MRVSTTKKKRKKIVK
uniref:Uncharacterized protein n=1 Tax=Arundo donax TaxID=35708 RepID=A0A0A9Q1Q6_ARUDO